MPIGFIQNSTTRHKTPLSRDSFRVHESMVKHSNKKVSTFSVIPHRNTVRILLWIKDLLLFVYKGCFFCRKSITHTGKSGAYLIVPLATSVKSVNKNYIFHNQKNLTPCLLVGYLYS